MIITCTLRSLSIKDLFSFSLLVFFMILVSCPVKAMTPMIQSVLISLDPLSKRFSSVKATFLFTDPETI